MVEMEDSDAIELLLEIRAARREARDDDARLRLLRAEDRLVSALGPSVPKRVASRLCAISMSTIDDLVRRGLLPVVERPGVSRLQLEAGPLVRFVEALRAERQESPERGLVARTVRRLGWIPSGAPVLVPEQIAHLPRPNVSVAELVEQFERTSATQRLQEAMSLSRFVTGMWVAGGGATNGR